MIFDWCPKRAYVLKEERKQRKRTLLGESIVAPCNEVVS